MKKEINASVHDIVDFVFSQGDIVPIMAQKNNMRDGTLIHIDIQKQYACEKEFYVKYTGDVHNYQVTLQGRIDLLEKNENSYHLIEIKSTHTFEDLTETSYLAHFAQAKFYGFMLFNHLKLDKNKDVTISVMYVNKYTYEKKFFIKVYAYDSLNTFFNETINKYIEYISVIDNWHELKLNQLPQLKFPFATYRKGQSELINNVYDVIEANDSLFVCAPTGIGKSLGTIYPTLKTIRSKENKIFYLTSKSMVKDVARGALELMRQNSDLLLKSLTITAKDKICINDCVKCNPKDCIYAKGFYNRINDAVLDIFENVDDMYVDNIIMYAKKHQVCPFEYQLTLSLFSDIIICDYNYVFDVRVYLRRFFDFDTSDLILLIDEAHNMYDRVCNMFTTNINFKTIHTILDYIDNEKEIIKSCQVIISKLKQYQNHLKSENKKALKFNDIDEVLLNDIASIISKLEKYFDKMREKEKEIPEELLDSYFNLSAFLKIADYYCDDFMIWVTNSYDELIYQITCLNPRELIRMRTSTVKSSIFFSATLHPINYYLYLLGGDNNTKQLILDSPFEQYNLNVLINPHISTKYNNREETKYQIAYEIEQLIASGGKYIIYFSSYQYLELVYKTFLKINEFEVEIIKQERSMKESEQSNFISQFDESSKNIVGFAVLGGIFAEGIDLKGEKLNGIAVIGVGLPMFDDFRNELKNYFEIEYKKGYQFAYIYPGFNKVLQAVGRVIRSEDDKGCALLIDERYSSYEYLKLFPKHWSHYIKI